MIMPGALLILSSALAVASKQTPIMREDQWPVCPAEEGPESNHSRNSGNLTMLFDAFPQFREPYLDGSDECLVALMHMLVNFRQANVSALNFYSLHFYSDLGYPNACHQEANGSYMQAVVQLPPMPLGIPLGLCLPAACNSSEYF